MSLSEFDKQRYVEAMQWAMLPENRDTLPPELITLLRIVEAKINQLTPKQKMQMTVNFGVKEIGLTFTPTPLPYYVRG